jgi:hypothetical protein
VSLNDEPDDDDDDEDGGLSESLRSMELGRWSWPTTKPLD